MSSICKETATFLSAYVGGHFALLFLWLLYC